MTTFTRRAICNATAFIPLGDKSPNLLAVGGCGAGKSQNIIIPAFDGGARKHGCVFINCKGRRMTRVLQEIARQRGRKATVLAFRDPARSVGWNPIKEIVTLGDAREIAVCLAQSARGERHSQSGDGSWFDNQAIEWMTSAIHAVAQDSPTNEQHLLTVRDVVLRGTFKLFAQAHPRHPALSKFDRFESSGNTNSQTIAATIGEHLLFLDDEAVAAILANDELRLVEFVNAGEILIVEIDEADTDMLRPLTTLFIRRLFSTLLSQASGSMTGALPQRFFIFIDELGAAGRIPSLDVVLNTCRERGISIVAGIQSLAQIHDIYGTSSSAVIAGFQTQIAMAGGLDAVSAEYFSRRSGTMTVKNFTIVEDYDDAIGASRWVGRSWSPVARPVLLPSEIARPDRHPLLGLPSTVFLGTGTPPFHAYLPAAHTIGHLARAMERAASETNDRRQIPLAVPYSPSSESHNGLSLDQIRSRYAELKKKVFPVALSNELQDAWKRLEEENEHRPEFLLQVVEALLKRNCTIADLFSASTATKSAAISANLAYLDYVRAKWEADVARREKEKLHELGRFLTGERVPQPGGLFRAMLRPKQLKTADARLRYRELKGDEVFPDFNGAEVQWERTNMRRKEDMASEDPQQSEDRT